MTDAPPPETADRPAPEAKPHRRTRRDHATELAEDYVEAIAELSAESGHCRVVDLARRFGVSHVTVNRTIKRLTRDGYVTSEPYRPVELTDAGRALAETSRARHATVLAFLRAIGVPEEVAAVDAEGIEHHVSAETLACFRKVIEGRGA
ncbi:MAG: manganese-binding transcriptional regulator MntR [Planctomycetota bacterium]